MKILLITDNLYPELGGSFKAITDTSKILTKNPKFTCRIVIKNNGKFKKRLDLFFLIKNFDIIHYFGGWSFFHFKVLVLSFIFKKKTIITPMGIYEDWSLSQKKFKKLLGLNFYQKFILNKVNAIHVTSKSEMKSLQKISSNKNIVLIPHGIEEKKIINKKIFNGDKKKALFFSRLHKKKGIEELVDTWLKIKNNEWELHIYGPDYDNFKEKILKKINKNKSIFIFEPVFEKKDKIFKDFDLFILPSKSENFGYVVLEAMQNGIPVLTTNATPWLTLEKKNIGWIISSDLKDLEKSLNKILHASKSEFQKKSINAQNFTKEYSWDRIENRYFKLYKKIN
ncbi:glycosyltransferase [Candidatus Pelagibacter sp.]|uniref:glycosyltransferase n=1 Tax=Candidatus Pelagibacter sp. TaxID=2024849 RepID=UPI003F87C4BE